MKNASFLKSNKKIVLIVASLLAVILVLYRATQRGALVGSMGNGPNKVAIAVLGGGVDSEGNIYQHVELRIAKAVELYERLKNSKGPNSEVTLIPLSGGTVHKPPPRDELGFPIAEATAGARVMVKKYKVPPQDIREESWSVDTLGNCYFLRTLMIDPASYDKVIVITNDWHMPRSRAMFEHCFSLPSENSAGRVAPELEFISVAAGLDGEVLSARQAREGSSLLSFSEKVKPQISNMEQFAAYIFTKHEAYASSRLLHKRKALDRNIMKTY